jgi:hypothetical protein
MIHRLFAVLSFPRQSLQGVLLRRKLPQEKIPYRDRTVTLFQLFVKARSSLCFAGREFRALPCGLRFLDGFSPQPSSW